MMFRPKIIGFICNWSLPREAEIASTSPLNGYPRINIIRVMCIGRIDPTILLETFENGADGILVLGCHPPDCHYITGNLQAERKIGMLKKLISLMDLEPDRLRLDWIHTNEVGHFIKIVSDFRNHIMSLGPSHLNMLLNLKAAKVTVESFRIRLLISKEIELTEKENVFGEKISREEFEKVIDATIEDEYLRNKIFLILKNGQFSVKEISQKLDIDPREVLRQIVVMKKKGLLTVYGVKGTTPIYTALERVRLTRIPLKTPTK